MRIAFFVNSIDSETPGYTTTHLALAAHRRGHAVVYVTPGDFVLRPDDKAVFFCRSGMRSAAAWAMADRLAGGEPDVLRDAAATAGYDLSRVPL